MLPLNTEFRGARKVNCSFPERCELRPACLRRSMAVETSDSAASSSSVLATGRRNKVQKVTGSVNILWSRVGQTSAQTSSC